MNLSANTRRTQTRVETDIYQHDPTPSCVHVVLPAIDEQMERKGLTMKDLEPMIGKSNRVYESLNRKRSLALKMTRKLHEGLGIPAESLIKPPRAHA